MPSHIPVSSLCAPTFFSKTYQLTFLSSDNLDNFNGFVLNLQPLPTWKHFKVLGNFWEGKKRSPNRDCLLPNCLLFLQHQVLKKLLPQHPSLSAPALHIFWQNPNITPSFTCTSVSALISTISLAYILWKYRWSQSLCCSYTRWGSRTGCMQQNMKVRCTERDWVL